MIGRVVAGDRGLAGDLDELLPDIDLDGTIKDRNEKAQAGVTDHALVGAPEPEDDHLLVLLHHPDRKIDDDHEHDEDKRDGCGDDRDFHGDLRAIRTAMMMTVRAQR